MVQLTRRCVSSTNTLQRKSRKDNNQKPFRFDQKSQLLRLDANQNYKIKYDSKYGFESFINRSVSRGTNNRIDIHYGSFEV